MLGWTKGMGLIDGSDGSDGSDVASNNRVAPARHLRKSWPVAESLEGSHRLWMVLTQTGKYTDVDTDNTDIDTNKDKRHTCKSYPSLALFSFSIARRRAFLTSHSNSRRARSSLPTNKPPISPSITPTLNPTELRNTRMKET